MSEAAIANPVPACLPPGPCVRLPGGMMLRARRQGMLAMLSSLATEYGDFAYFTIFRQRFCLVIDPEVIRRVVVTDNALFTKSHVLANAKAALGDGLLTADGELHKKQRRMIAPVFHAQKVKAFADDFVTQARRAAGHWQDGQTLNLNEAMTDLTLRVVTQSLFDTDLEDEVRPIGHDMATIVEMFERTRNPLASLLGRLPLPSNRRFAAALGRVDERIGSMMRARRGAPDVDDRAGARFDLLSLLLAARDAHDQGGQGMSEKQVRDEAVTLFMAGHETTANALIWTFVLLADNAEAEAALHAELDAVLPDGRAATAEDMPNLKYTRAVVSESMRLRPPAWIIARRAVADYDLGPANGPALSSSKGPYRVPAGTTLLMPQYIVHRDPRWWPEPERFRPQRWLEEAGDRPRYAYYPFGGGPRSCVGETFAWMESILLLATLAQHWRLSRVDDKPVELFPTITLRPKDAVQMIAHARPSRR